mmetsp:Transcript_103424/g.183733  ORF Transcript_103424/g.183733 Transcript_103424/m.183733 type:complete len:231 (-) Transcript_103424:283-975(-)
MYASSLHFMAPSRAMGKLNPRPRKMKFGAKTFWQPMSHRAHSPIWRECSSTPSWCRGLDSLSKTSKTLSGSSSSLFTKAMRSAGGIGQQASPSCMAKSEHTKPVAVKTLVDATPCSSPASTSMYTSHSRANVEDAWLTIATVSTLPPFSERRTFRRLSTAAAVSPELEIKTITSPERTSGCRYLNSEAYWHSTGILARCSTRYSARRAACQELPDPMMVNLLLKEAPQFA